MKELVHQKKIFYFQAVTTFLVMLGFLMAFGVVSAYSAFLGGLAFILPMRLSVLVYFRKKTKVIPRDIVKLLYIGTGLKAIVSVGIFIILFAFVTIDGPAFFGVFILMQMIFFIMQFKNRENK